jgi:ubiquinone/menaquinone biosynthesis C-methylase UbiE
MATNACPLWMGHLLVSPVRRWFSEKPKTLLEPYVREGMRVLEPGPGTGFFTLPLAEMVGPSGRVIAVDIQPEMLDKLEQRAHEADLLDRIELKEAEPDRFTMPEWESTIDFVLAFSVVHEVKSAEKFFHETAAALRHRGIIFFAEPAGKVTERQFEKELNAARWAGFVIAEEPYVRRSRAAVLRKV